MKKLANALDTVGWFIFVIGILVGVWLASGVRHLDEILACLAAGVIPGTLILLICQAHMHYLAVAENLNNYLMTQAQPMPGVPMQPIPQPFPAQFAPQQPQQAPQQPQQAPQQPQQK